MIASRHPNATVERIRSPQEDQDMALTVDQFAEDCRQILSQDSSEFGLEKVRLVVEKFLADQEFIDEHLGPDNDSNRTVLYEDPEFEFCICAHVFKGSNEAPPHDHGPTWAIYGQAAEHTIMREWDRTDDGSDDENIALEKTKEYRLDPGQVGVFNPGAIHSIEYPNNARFVRVTGVDLEGIDRKAYNLERRTVKTIRSESADPS